MISLSLLTVNYLFLLVLVLVIADVCHRTQYYEQVVEESERSKCFLTDSYRNLLPFRPFSPLVLHLATEITCVYSDNTVETLKTFLRLMNLQGQTCLCWVQKKENLEGS
jgi:hypothetical protein